MRLRMTFQVGGILRLSDHFPIVSDGIQLTFRTDGDKITHVVCECDVAKEDQYPTIKTTGEKSVLNVNCDEFALITDKFKLAHLNFEWVTEPGV